MKGDLWVQITSCDSWQLFFRSHVNTLMCPSIQVSNGLLESFLQNVYLVLQATARHGHWAVLQFQLINNVNLSKEVIYPYVELQGLILAVFWSYCSLFYYYHCYVHLLFLPFSLILTLFPLVKVQLIIINSIRSFATLGERHSCAMILVSAPGNSGSPSYAASSLIFFLFAFSQCCSGLAFESSGVWLLTCFILRPRDNTGSSTAESNHIAVSRPLQWPRYICSWIPHLNYPSIFEVVFRIWNYSLGYVFEIHQIV